MCLPGTDIGRILIPLVCGCYECNEGRPSKRRALMERGRLEDRERAKYELGPLDPLPELVEPPAAVVAIEPVEPPVALDPRARVAAVSASLTAAGPY